MQKALTTPSKIVDDYQLSPAQEGMIFHNLLEPGNGIYLLQYVANLEGTLIPSTFSNAWEQVVRRHPVLRTSIVSTKNQAQVQRVHAHASIPIAKYDWQAHSQTDQEQLWEELLLNDQTHDFDLETAPLMRLALISLGSNRWRFLWTVHHAIVDGQSSYIILKDFFSFYRKITNNSDLPTPQATPFHKYFMWLESRETEGAGLFWEKTLKNVDTTTSLPNTVGNIRQEKHDWNFRSTTRLIDPITTSQLKAFANKNSLTLTTLLQGAWAILLSRYSGEETVVFGTVRSGRNPAIEGVKTMAGVLLNTLPLRADLYPGKKLVPWLKELRNQWLAGREHEQTPLVQLQHWSDLPKGQSLFETIVLFDDASIDLAMKNACDGWLNCSFELHTHTHYPLSLLAGIEPDGLKIKIEYRDDHFESASVKRMAAQLQVILEAMLESPPDLPIELIPMIGDEERQTISRWNDTARNYSSDKCTHHLFEEQAGKTPDTVAVIYENQHLTYQELDKRANQLAHELISFGVSPDIPVGLCVGRSLETAVGVLGILKAGGAYIPLDPTYPAERISFMLSDTNSPILLTQQNLADDLPEHSAKVICLDSNWNKIELNPTTPPKVKICCDNLAYLIYTSGSTGKPKGVAMPHRPLCNLVIWQSEILPLQTGAPVAQYAPLSFDVSYQEMFTTWSGGGTLHIAPEIIRRDPVQLFEFLSNNKIRRLYLPFVALRMLAETASYAKQLPDSLTEIITAGEQLQITPDVIAFLNNLKGCKLYNHYGPSETHVVTSYTLEGPPETWSPLPSIGKPIFNTVTRILDRQMNLAPIGAPGELFIGGDCLARGYLNRPNLTSEKFISDPFATTQMLYKSGDLARYLPGGNIEYLGRADQQVKIRGYRVEPGEIENILSKFPGVRQTAVIPREDTPGNKRLVAYILPIDTTNDLQAEQLRTFLREQLPDYMVPSAFIVLAKLPLTPSGKLDRKSLPAPDSSTILQFDQKIQEATSPTEKKLVHIFSSVLNIKGFGIDESFLDLGGDSLRAVVLMMKIEKEFGYSMPLSTVFQAPTVKSLSKFIDEGQNSNPSKCIVPVQTKGSRPPFFCVPGVLGQVVNLHDLANSLGKNQPFYGLQLPGLDGLENPLDKVEDLAILFIAKMREVQPHGPYFLGGYSAGGLIAYEMACRLNAAGEDVPLLAIFDTGSANAIQWTFPTIISTAAHLIKSIPSILVHDVLRSNYKQIWGKCKHTINVLSRPIRARFGEDFSNAKTADVEAAVGVDTLPDAYRTVLSAMSSAFIDYVAQPAPIKVTLFRAQRPPILHPLPQDMGWGKLATGGVEIVPVPGSHSTILRPPVVHILAKHIRAFLDRYTIPKQ